MAKSVIKGDGIYEVSVDKIHSDSTIFFANELYGANVEICIRTDNGLVRMGTLKENSYEAVSHGYLHDLVANVTGWTQEFEILYNRGGGTNYSDVLEEIRDNTSMKTFLDLSDTPSSYSGNQGKILLVGNEGIEFAESSGRTIEQKSVGYFSTTSTQEPSGLGASNSLVLSFGPGGITSDGEFLVGSDGIIERLSGDDQIDMEIILRFTRDTNAGEARMVARLMHAPDGVNFVQLKDTFGAILDSSENLGRETFSLKLNLAEGSKTYVEIARDPAGRDTGGIGTFELTGDLATWAPVPSASLDILKTKI
ncbi:hypothetical protein [Vibrio phage vB_VpaP_SJSY21]|nr:hypothetical protein [Vibrio phage vB_VpaP_SJSY21]